MNKKIVFHNTDSVLCKSADEIKISSREDILIETNASIISTGTELSIWAGSESWAPLPYTPGYGSVGTILEVGNSVKDLKEGDVCL